MTKSLLLLLILSSFAFGQNTSEIIYFKDKYRVKKASKGRYMLAIEAINDSITRRTFSNTKTGQKIWKETYLGEQPYGTWERYDNDGKVIGKTDYNFKLKYGKYATPEMLAELDELPLVITPSEKNKNTIQTHIRKAYRYPEKAQQENIQGKVVVMFTISEKGKVGDVRILEGIHVLLDTEAFRIARTLPSLEPVTKNGEIIRAKCKVPITFLLQ